jgi:putative tricarboxylic transport membrane protein
MRNLEAIASVFWVAVGIAFCIGSMKYGLLEKGTPGPGLLPFFGGAVLISLGISVLLFSSFRPNVNTTLTEGRFFPEKDSLRKLCVTVLALVAYTMLLEFLGFLIMTLLFMVLLLRFIETQEWRTVFTASALTAASFYIVFEVLLKVQLPKGILGI